MKMKLSRDDRKKIIEMYEMEIPQTRIAKRFNLNVDYVKRIVKSYKTHGDVIFEPGGKRRVFDEEFRYTIVSKVLSGASKKLIANEYMLSPSIINLWLQKYKELGYNGLKEKKKEELNPMKKRNEALSNTNDTISNFDEESEKLTNEERKELIRLRKANKQLEMENEILKKLKALVQQRTQQQEKKK